MIGDYDKYTGAKHGYLRELKYVTPKGSWASRWCSRPIADTDPEGDWECVDCWTVKDRTLMARWNPGLFSAMDEQDLLAGKGLPLGSCKECETLRERGEIQ